MSYFYYYSFSNIERAATIKATKHRNKSSKKKSSNEQILVFVGICGSSIKQEIQKITHTESYILDRFYENYQKNIYNMKMVSPFWINAVWTQLLTKYVLSITKSAQPRTPWEARKSSSFPIAKYVSLKQPTPPNLIALQQSQLDFCCAPCQFGLSQSNIYFT